MVLKTNYSYLTTLTLVLMLTACSSDSDLQSPAEKEIQLFSQVAQSTRAADDADNLQVTQLASGTKITVKVKENASTPSVDYPLATYTADGSGGLSLPEGMKQYYPANGNGVNIYAFHPMGVGSTFEVQTDQKTDANYIKSDLMWASLSDINADSSPAQRTLVFRHKLSKIVVEIKKTEEFSATELATATLRLGNDNLITSGSFAAATGTFTPATSGTGTITLAENAGTATYTAIVVPQAISGKKINLTIGDLSSSYSILTEAFESGKRYTYVLTVGLSGKISLITSEITDWLDVEIFKDM